MEVNVRAETGYVGEYPVDLGGGARKRSVYRDGNGALYAEVCLASDPRLVRVRPSPLNGWPPDKFVKLRSQR